MSVSQVKKRFSEFESFLRNDKEGLRRLKLLKDDVNVLRTSLAAAEEAKQLAIVIKDAARERADKAEAERNALKLESESLRLQMMTLNGQIARLTKSDNETEDPEDISVDLEATELKATIKALRRRLPFCPKGSWGKFRKKHIAVFNREDFSTGWSRDELWVLGASVALLAAQEEQVCIQTTRNLRNVTGRSDEHDPASMPGYLKNLIRWFSKNINVMQTDADILRAKISEKLGSRWADAPDADKQTHEFLYGADD
jgi:hypothetical protein